MFAPPKKGAVKHTKRKDQASVEHVDVKALIKDFKDSYRRLDDYVGKEKKGRDEWDKHSAEKLQSGINSSRDNSTRQNEEATTTTPLVGKQQAKTEASPVSMDKDGSVVDVKRSGNFGNIYDGEISSETVGQEIVGPKLPDDVSLLLESYPKKFHELRKVMEDMKVRHAKSVARLQQKMKKDANRREAEAREAAKRNAQEETEKLRRSLKQQRAKSLQALESVKMERQKLIDSQAKKNRALRLSENKMAELQKALDNVKKQLTKSQRESEANERGKVAQRAKASKEKKRADILQRDIKALQSGIESVRLLNQQNESITQHDYDVLQWKFRAIVQVVREIDSINTPPDLGKTPSLKDVVDSRNARRRRVPTRLPAISYQQTVPGTRRGVPMGRAGVYKRTAAQKRVIHQIPRRGNKPSENPGINNSGDMLALTLPKSSGNGNTSSTASSRKSSPSKANSSATSNKTSGQKSETNDSARAPSSLLSIPSADDRTRSSSVSADISSGNASTITGKSSELSQPADKSVTGTDNNNEDDDEGDNEEEKDRPKVTPKDTEALPGRRDGDNVGVFLT